VPRDQSHAAARPSRASMARTRPFAETGARPKPHATEGVTPASVPTATPAVEDENLAATAPFGIGSPMSVPTRPMISSLSARTAGQ
jgi:hypothetical protein